MTTTKVRQLSGRVIESVKIFSGNGTEDALSLEIRCVGGVYFSFELTAQVRQRAHVLLADDSKDELRNQRSQDFFSTREAPWNIPEAGDE